jgi:TP901-1 family phage major tail protein
MAIGRLLLLRKAGTAIACIRAKTLSWNGETIDLTTDDDGGIRLLANVPAGQSISISGEGVADETVMRNIALVPGTSKMLTDITIVTEDSYTLAGDFMLTTYEITGSHDGEATYSLSLESSDAWTFTGA